MAELSRSTFPAGGWAFFQPQTNWSAPTPIGSTFDQTVILIIKHRQANPAIVASHNLKTDFASVASELEAFTRLRLGMSAPGQPDPPVPGATPKAARCCGG